MSRPASRKLQGAGQTPACPSCRGGMYWDFQDRCWLCIICGHREVKKTVIRRTGVAAAKVWNKVFEN